VLIFQQTDDFFTQLSNSIERSNSPGFAMLIPVKWHRRVLRIWSRRGRMQVVVSAATSATARGTAMNRYALAAALAICLGSPAQAAVIDLAPGNHAAVRVQPPVRNLSVTQRQDIVTPPANMSELPEPEVFAMMLLGLILIGYKAGRDSSENFK
jgi:hypothetical protein